MLISRLHIRLTILLAICVAFIGISRPCYSDSITPPSSVPAGTVSGASILSRYPRAAPVKVFDKFDQSYRSGEWDSLDLSSIHAGYDLGLPIGYLNRCPVKYTPSSTVFGRSSRGFLENGLVALRSIELDAFSASKEQIEWAKQNFRWSLLCAEYENEPELSALSLVYMGFACYLEGEDTDAQGFLNGVMVLLQSSLQQDDDRRLNVLMQLCSVYHELNAYDAEYQCLEMLIPVVQKVRGPACDLLATVYNRRGNACYWSTQTGNASIEYDKSLAILNLTHPNLSPLVKANLHRTSPQTASIMAEAIDSAAKDLFQIDLGTESSAIVDPAIGLGNVVLNGQSICKREDARKLSLEYVQALQLLWNLEDLKPNTVHAVLELTHSINAGPGIPEHLKKLLVNRRGICFPRSAETSESHPWIEFATYCALSDPTNEELTGALNSTLSQERSVNLKQQRADKFELLQKLAMEYQSKLDDSSGGGYGMSLARTDLNPDCSGCAYKENMRAKIDSHLDKSHPLGRISIGLRVRSNGELDQVCLDEDDDADPASAQSALVAILSSVPFDRFPNKSLHQHTDNDGCFSVLISMCATVPASETAEWTAIAYKREIERRVKKQLSKQFPQWIKSRTNELSIEIDRNGRVMKVSPKGSPLPAEDSEKLSRLSGLPAVPGSMFTPITVDFWH